MDVGEKTRLMLEKANEAYDKAKKANNQEAMDEIVRDQITPLRSLLANIDLQELSDEAKKLDELSNTIQECVRELEGSISRFFLDDFVNQAMQLNLIRGIPLDSGTVGPAKAVGEPEGEKEEHEEEVVGPEEVLTPEQPVGRKEDVGRPEEPGGGRVEAGAVSRPTPAGTARRMDVSKRDLDALIRVANSEVGHFGQYGAQQLQGGLAAVVDTIFNRVAHDKFPDTIEEVVNQPKQFSAVNKTGDWSGLRSAPQAIADIVTEHVTARAHGKASEIKGATHFLNPYISSPSAMKQWGSFVQKNPVAVYGSDINKDVHYHGFPPGAHSPGPYTIAYCGSETEFDGNGIACSIATGSGTGSPANIKQKIVEICQEELALFNNGQATETDDPQYRRVGEYWKVVGVTGRDGRTVIDNKRPPWSAAFVSFVLKQAGAGDRFPYRGAHWEYFQYFAGRSGPLLYKAILATEVTPQPGDILHYGREEAKNYDFDAARVHSPYRSHSDIVVFVDLAARIVKTIGGNVGDSVGEKTYALDDNGLLKDRVEHGQTYPWIGMLRLT